MRRIKNKLRSLLRTNSFPFSEVAKRNFSVGTKGSTRIDSHNIQYGTRPQEVKVAIVDSGIDTKHPGFRNQVIYQKDFVHGGYLAEDDSGHGTHVAGIISTLATSSKVAVANSQMQLLTAKASDLWGAHESSMVESIRWGADNGADIINISLKGPDSEEMRRAIDYAISKETLIVAAAGNQGRSTPVYPAAYPEVIAVAATDELDQLSCSSNYGSWVDVAVPGMEVLSTIPGGGYGRQNGTSQASAYVTALAVILTALGYSRHEIRSRMKGRPRMPELEGFTLDRRLSRCLETNRF